MVAATDAQRILKSADLLCSADVVTQAVQRVAVEIRDALGTTQPLVLCVMTGAVVFTGHLLPLLQFPLDLDYVHVTRYGDATRGGALEWKMFPAGKMAGRVVLVLDDILDEGHTLAEIRRRVLESGALRFHAAVLVDKNIGRAKPVTADFVGVTVPNRYVFGFGMDVQGAWRNLPEIFALKSGKE